MHAECSSGRKENPHAHWPTDLTLGADRRRTRDVGTLGAASTRCQRRSFLLRRAHEAGPRDPAHVALRFPVATGSLRHRVLNWGITATEASTTRVQPLDLLPISSRRPRHLVCTVCMRCCEARPQGREIFKHILVPIDLSDQNARTLKTALDLAISNRARVTLL